MKENLEESYSQSIPFKTQIIPLWLFSMLSYLKFSLRTIFFANIPHFYTNIHIILHSQTRGKKVISTISSELRAKIKQKTITVALPVLALAVIKSTLLVAFSLCAVARLGTKFLRLLQRHLASWFSLRIYFPPCIFLRSRLSFRSRLFFARARLFILGTSYSVFARESFHFNAMSFCIEREARAFLLLYFVSYFWIVVAQEFNNPRRATTRI